MEIPIKAKYAIIFGLGASFGSVITGYFVRKKAMAKLDEEIEKTRNYFIDMQKEGVAIEKEYRETTDSISKYDGPAPEAETIDYTRFYKVKRDDLAEAEHPKDDEEDPNYIVGKQMSESADAEGIEVINRDSYDVDYPQFEKNELTYWAVDGILADSEENVIDNIDAVVGSTIFDTGLVEYPDVNTIYIRNFNLGCDYCINKVQGSYRENIVT